MLMIFAALGHLNREGMAVAGNSIFIEKLNLSATQMGWVYSSLLIAYTVGMLPSGWLIDRIGSARTLTLFGVTMGTFVMLTGMIGWYTSDPNQIWLALIVVRSFAGIGCSPLHPGAAHMVSESVESRHQPIANGLRTAGALLGVAFSYPILGWMFDHMSWPMVFICSGGALIIYGLIWGGLTRSTAPAPARDNSAVESGSTGSNWLLFKDGRLFMLTLSYMAYGYFQYLFFYWMEYYFLEVLKVPKGESQMAAFWINIAQGVGMAVGGMSTSLACAAFGLRRGRQCIVIAGMSLGAAFALIAVNVQGLTSVAICLAISMASIGMCEGVFWTTATDIGGRRGGFSGAFMNTGGNVGGLISPVLTPIMSKYLGWSGAIGVGCAICLLGGAIWLLIPTRDQTRADAGVSTT